MASEGGRNGEAQTATCQQTIVWRKTNVTAQVTHVDGCRAMGTCKFFVPGPVRLVLAEKKKFPDGNYNALSGG